MIIERIKAMLEACEAGIGGVPADRAVQRGLAAADRPRLVRAATAATAIRSRPCPVRAGSRRRGCRRRFMSRFRGDRLAEARTHADGVLGHFAIGDPGTAALSLTPRAPGSSS